MVFHWKLMTGLVVALPWTRLWSPYFGPNELGRGVQWFLGVGTVSIGGVLLRSSRPTCYVAKMNHGHILSNTCQRSEHRDRSIETKISRQKWAEQNILLASGCFHFSRNACREGCFTKSVFFFVSVLLASFVSKS